MKIIFDLGHPAHVHYSHNCINILLESGHNILITARDKEMTKNLLEAYKHTYVITDKHRTGMLNKGFGLLINDLKLLTVAKRFKPDIFVSFGSPYAAHVSRLLGVKHITFVDSEYVKINSLLTYPFSEVICTPTSFRQNLGPRQKRFNGFLELSYLHPKYFKPDPSVLSSLELKKNEKLFIIRFISWAATHDLHQSGIPNCNKLELIEHLKHFGRVIISSESYLPPELECYRSTIPPEKIHHLLAFADMYIGEGGTMATESAILGTPSILINSLAQKMGNFIELENTYGLLHSFSSFDSAFEKIHSLQMMNNLRREWSARREKLLLEKIDVTEWMVNSIETLYGQ